MNSISLDDFKKKLSINFDDSFFQEEVRCGFLVTEKQKKIWAVELDLLSQLLVVCNKHNLKLFVFAGSLLGAVRHKGFIPWDDDLDVCMPREDFEKLCKLAPSVFKEPYFLQSDYSDRQYFFGYARLRNSLTTGFVLCYSSPTYNQGIYVDVYVCDGLTSDQKLFNRQIKKNIIFGKLLNLYGNNIDASSKFKSLLKKIMFKTVCPILFKILNYELVYSWYKNNITKYNATSEVYSTLTHDERIIRRMKFNKKEYEKIIYLPFENIAVPVPAGYDRMLKSAYGDYMEFPPIEKRGVWHEGIIEFDPEIPYKKFFEKKYQKKK